MENIADFSMNLSNVIRMESVKTLIILLKDAPREMILPKLEEVHMKYQFDTNKFAWIKFFRNHTSVKRLWINLSGLHELTDMNQFTTHLPELTEVFVKNRAVFAVDEIL